MYAQVLDFIGKSRNFGCLTVEVGGHRLMLRELSRMVNAEIREARELGLRMTAL